MHDPNLERAIPHTVTDETVTDETVTDVARLRTLMIIAVLLAAFALRLYHLDFQSLEGDEGISLQRSSQPFGQMIERMPVEHVPGYFVLLYGWLRTAGEHDFALRYFSVLPSVAAVALVYRWAASMGRPVIGLIAALLLATNSFQIWYAQQARMYSWLLMTSLFSFWSLWEIVRPDYLSVQHHHFVGLRPAIGEQLWWRKPQHREGSSSARSVREDSEVPVTRNNGYLWDLIYILSTAATVYLHYFGFLIPIAQTIFMAIRVMMRGSWRITLRWMISGVIIFLLFLPWLGNAITFLSFQGWREPLDPWQVPWMMHRAYSVGFPMPQPWQMWLPWVYLGLAVLGLIVWWRRNRYAWLLLVTASLVPALLIFIAVLRNPDFHERYSMFLAAPWMLIIAGAFGAVLPLGEMTPRQTLPSWFGVYPPALLVVALVATNGLALKRLYFDATLHKPDYHGAAYRIHSSELPGDVVVVDGPNPELVFNHYYYDYYQGQAPVYDLRPLADKAYERVGETLQEYTHGAERVWEVLFFRSPGPVQFWLATHGWASAPTDHNGIRVMLYGLDRRPLVEQQKETAFGEALTLRTAGVEGPTARAGDLLRVTTSWQVRTPLPEYKFSLRLSTPDGQMILADDYVPQNWFAPTSQWAVGEMVDQRALLLPVDLNAGEYVVTLRLYDPADGVPVETEEGQDVVLGVVEVRGE